MERNDDPNCPHHLRHDRAPDIDPGHVRPHVPILRYDDLYYCFADLVIGPVLPTVQLTLPSFAKDRRGKLYVRERSLIGFYPQNDGPEDVVSIKPVPICHRTVMDTTLMTYGQWVREYRDLPGTPFYSSTYDDGDYCKRASRYDADGAEAQEHAMFYFEEAMRAHADMFGTTESLSDWERQQHHDCLKLAEILFRHAAGRGNARAWLALGRIYDDDLNHGDYFDSCYTASIKGQPPIIEQPPLPERARICFERAATLGDAEALAFLGDLRLEGRTCRRDARRAFALYEEAYARGGGPGQVRHAQAAAALRLARCYEYGVGCAVDTAKALTLYRYAQDHLADIATKNPWWYLHAHAEAADEIAYLTNPPIHLAVGDTDAIAKVSYTPITKYLPTLERMDDFGTTHIGMDWFFYNDDVIRFMDAVSRFAEEHPELGARNYLGFLEASILSTPIDNVDPADCDARTVFLMIFYGVRQERFCTGLLNDLLRAGTIQRWLRRLAQLDEERMSAEAAQP
ncbi:hypothetical protein B1400_0426 [Bifidobacterium italicum]|uniref:TPR repeat protein n=1 Tax=Bifidobacterium italicum TaxID=1960968 RepID=A0A2A2ELE8_9BIFI|nr:DUF6508 domain-containing protein [Bifidobacterium italicum]PAU69891.1 hypothetical protein B1400_0426 [Bifidobacterium italicum]